MLLEALKPNPQKEMQSRKEAGQQEVYIKPNLKQRLQFVFLSSIIHSSIIQVLNMNIIIIFSYKVSNINMYIERFH
jgi:hypothetical protein